MLRGRDGSSRAGDGAGAAAPAVGRIVPAPLEQGSDGTAAADVPLVDLKAAVQKLRMRGTWLLRKLAA